MKNWILPLLLVCLMLLAPSSTCAQRIQQRLGRGVVAVPSASGVMLTWRRLAQEPENARYNVYVSASGQGEYRKLNAAPLSNTNYAATLTAVPYGSYVAVSLVDGEKEGERSKPFRFNNTGQRNIYMEIHYDASPLDKKKYTTKFVWPCDLDGDGEMDYVVDRCPVDGSRNFYVEGYLADGTFLWNVDLGVNEVPCDGQNDNMCAYDIDCDGRGELIVQTSDGARFWDKARGTWGKYLLGKATADSDGDGIIDYETQGTRNPPRYMTVVDGMTGEEKASAEFAYDVAYNRSNKAQLMGEEYNKHEGHVGIFYHDGIHPAIVGEWHTRSADGNTHYYRNVAFGYVGGEWKLMFSKQTGGVVFHQIRIADVDGDGCDEMLSGEYAMDQDGSTLYNARIAHGDRHRIADIDPERPGLECFAIQQNAGDMLGQILYDAGTGEAIKKWYLSAVGDVGRGECMDVDRNHLGWEMWSTMEGVYDAKGDRIEGLPNQYPTEGMWWDGELDREVLQTSDSHYNFYFMKYNGGRIVEPAKESGYQLKTSYGKRGKFWGDIIGDWREELIVIREVDGVCQGIVGLTTDLGTAVNNIYCLQEDPHYRGDCTTRGYYQTPNPGFYLGFEMPRPQLPPCMVADEENDVFGIAQGNATVTPRQGVKNVYMMPVKGQTLTIGSPLQLSRGGALWKSQQGTLVIAAPTLLSPVGEQEGAALYISEGTVRSDATINAAIHLRARGTLAGAPVVNDTIILEGALNYEGCRLMPEGTMTFMKGLNVNRKTYVELDIDKGDLVSIRGNLQVTKPLIFTVKGQNLAEGEYTLMTYGGEFSGKESNMSVRGLTGLSYNIVNREGRILLVINGQREAAEGVAWTGAENGTWDYQTENFLLGGEATTFVAGDGLVFGDDAVETTVTADELMPAGSVLFNNEAKAYTIQGEGGLSGSSDLVVSGSGKVTLNAVKSDYTGRTILRGGTVTVKELADAGLPSSLGAAAADAENLQLGRTILVINNSNTATNRGIMLTDSATIQTASGTTALKGVITGTGKLTKTGAGQLNINSNANSWSGGTVLMAGTLAQGSWDARMGKAGSTIEVRGSATYKMFDSNSSSTMPNTNYVFVISKGKTLTLYAGSRCNVNGTLRGEGTYRISLPYVRADISTNTSAFEGTYDVLTSNCRFVQAMDLSRATLKLESGSYVAGFKAGGGTEQSYTHKVGAMAGSGALGTGVWNVGYLGLNDTFAGTFNAAATVNKYGSGALSLTGASEAAINIYEGTVYANNTAAPSTKGTITVRAGGTLAGNGQVQNVTVQKDGTLGAGKTTPTAATLTVGGNVSVAAGGRVLIRYRVASERMTADAFDVTGSVRLASPVIELVTLNNTELPDDAEIKVFTGSGTVTLTGTVTMVPVQPKAGWLWDTSSLASEGVLRIVQDLTGVNALEGEAEADVIYDLQGRRVDSAERGIYIINGKKVIVE